MTLLSSLASFASTQSASSIFTSTASMPRVWAQATPPMATLPAGALPRPLGVSMRAIVLIGPSADQSRSTQYWSKSANVVSSISVSHLVAERKP